MKYYACTNVYSVHALRRDHVFFSGFAKTFSPKSSILWLSQFWRENLSSLCDRMRCNYTRRTHCGWTCFGGQVVRIYCKLCCRPHTLTPLFGVSFPGATWEGVHLRSERFLSLQRHQTRHLYPANILIVIPDGLSYFGSTKTAAVVGFGPLQEHARVSSSFAEVTDSLKIDRPNISMLALILHHVRITYH